MNGDNNLSGLDMLTVFSVNLQVMGYQQNQEQTSNDALFSELQRQDSEYLDKIIETQNEILRTLSDIKSELADKG